MCLKINKFFVLCPAFLFASLAGYAQEPVEEIRVNQIGYYPQGPKVAVVVSEKDLTKFYIKSVEGQNSVYSGDLRPARKAEFSGRTTRVADFSGLSEPGKYYIEIPGLGNSFTFDVQPMVFGALAKASLKNYYFQRASIELKPEFAGKWARPAGHPDTLVFVHPSAATKQRPAGTVLRAPKGWYDAGDYNKYIVNSGITMGTMLSAYEDFSAFYEKIDLNIPESKNDIPDILDELLWNLRWMLAMQDLNDGGVYHKLTNPGFDPLDMMPHEATRERYVVKKSTAATLNFAAVMAQASRVFKIYEKQLPGLADSCMYAATRAWDWAKKNPKVLYKQEEMNKEYDPDITTGAYGDNEVADEFIWAAAELYVTSRNEDYIKSVKLIPEEPMSVPSWSNVRMLGYYSLVRFENQHSSLLRRDVAEIKNKIVSFAGQLTRGVSDRAYQTVMGGSIKDYIWGSSSVAANQAIVLIQAYFITNDKVYLDHALSNLDYLLGRNATGYSFVTAFGSKTPQNPHHRPSVAQEIEEPVPGMLVGGPNFSASKQDKCQTYTSAYPDEVFTDDACSYASNEIAINWNAPLVYLTAAMESLQQKAEYVIVKQ